MTDLVLATYATATVELPGAAPFDLPAPKTTATVDDVAFFIGAGGGGGAGASVWGDITGLLADQTDLAAALAGKATAAQGALAGSALQPGASIPWTDVTGKPAFFSGAYGDLSGIPATFAPSAHSHTFASLTSKPTTLLGYGITDAATAAQGALAGTALQPGASIPWTDVTGKPAFFSGAYGDLSGIPATFAPSAHSHTFASLTSKPTTLLGYGITDAATAAQGALAGTALQPGASIPWTDVTGKPAGFAPSAHSHAIADITALQTALDGRQPLTAVLTATTASFTTVLASKLAGIAAGATVNATDSALRDRSTHSGTQPVSTISDFSEAVDDRVAALLVAGANMTITYDDAAGTLTLGAAAGGGGGGSPGGASYRVQFNDGAGGFEGAEHVEIEGGYLRLNGAENPSVVADGGLNLYSQSLAGYWMPKVQGPSGIDSTLQLAMHGNAVVIISPGRTTAVNSVGLTALATATISHQMTFGSTSRWLSTRRFRGQTTTTPGNAAGIRSDPAFFRGSAPGFGGFFFRAQFGTSINLAGGQKFIGLTASAAVLAGDPSALINMCGVGYDAGDSSAGNWQFMLNDGSGVATKVDLGPDAPRTINTAYDLMMFMRPNSGVLGVKITNLTSNVVVLDTTYDTDIPAANTGLCIKCEARNGAVAAADNIEAAKIYVMSDF